MISKPSGLDWRLRNNAIGTDFSGGANGLKYFHPQRVWTANGFINARNAPLVHVDIYGRRR